MKNLTYDLANYELIEALTTLSNEGPRRLSPEELRKPGFFNNYKKISINVLGNFLYFVYHEKSWKHLLTIYMKRSHNFDKLKSRFLINFMGR